MQTATTYETIPDEETLRNFREALNRWEEEKNKLKSQLNQFQLGDDNGQAIKEAVQKYDNSPYWNRFIRGMWGLVTVLKFILIGFFIEWICGPRKYEEIEKKRSIVVQKDLMDMGLHEQNILSEKELKALHTLDEKNIRHWPRNWQTLALEVRNKLRRLSLYFIRTPDPITETLKHLSPQRRGSEEKQAVLLKTKSLIPSRQDTTSTTTVMTTIYDVNFEVSLAVEDPYAAAALFIGIADGLTEKQVELDKAKEIPTPEDLTKAIETFKTYSKKIEETDNPDAVTTDYLKKSQKVIEYQKTYLAIFTEIASKVINQIKNLKFRGEILEISQVYQAGHYRGQLFYMASEVKNLNARIEHVRQEQIEIRRKRGEIRQKRREWLKKCEEDTTELQRMTAELRQEITTLSSTEQEQEKLLRSAVPPPNYSSLSNSTATAKIV